MKRKTKAYIFLLIPVVAYVLNKIISDSVFYVINNHRADLDNAMAIANASYIISSVLLIIVIVGIVIGWPLAVYNLIKYKKGKIISISRKEKILLLLILPFIASLLSSVFYAIFIVIGFALMDIKEGSIVAIIMGSIVVIMRILWEVFIFIIPVSVIIGWPLAIYQFIKYRIEKKKT